MEPYRDRDIRFEGVRRLGGWALKVYSVRYGAEALDRAGFDEALEQAVAEVPAPDPSAGRPGLGFFIAHQGRTGDYGVLAWWNNDNELPLTVRIRRSRDEPWRAAEAGESVCVWDLEVIWAEREAWVATMLAAPGARREASTRREREASTHREREASTRREASMEEPVQADVEAPAQTPMEAYMEAVAERFIRPA